MGAGGIGAAFLLNDVAVVPVGKGASDLAIGEVAVPDELVDFGLPGNAKRKIRDGAEAKYDVGAGASCDTAARLGRCRAWWWRGENGFLDAGFLPRRHQTREVFGVGEEGEDQIDRIGKPLLGVIGVTHGLGWL